MKLWNLATFFAVLLLILSGCSVKPKPKKEPIVDETLPIVQLTRNGTIADINAIALEWVSIDDQRVKGIYIYKKSLDNKNSVSDEYYDTVDNRFSTHYVDTKVSPDSQYSYYFKTYSAEAESRPSKPTIITSLPPMDSITWIHSIQNMPRSAKIIWRPHTNQKVKAYLIQRRTLKSEYWKDIVTVKGIHSAEYIDENLKDKFTYIYRIRVLTYDNLTSKPSEEVKVITKALPKELVKIETTTNLPRRIEIKWEKTQTNDFLNYNLYRASNLDGRYKLLAAIKENSYVDNIEEDAKQYFYRVSVVDKDLLESIHDNYSIQGITLVKPTAPALVEAKLVDGKVKISWSKPDSRIKSYTVQKRYKKSFLDNSIEDFENIKGLEFIDSEIEVEKVYYYKVFSIDINGIKSEPSMEIEIKIGNILPNNGSQKNIQGSNVEQINYNEDLITPIKDFN